MKYLFRPFAHFVIRLFIFLLLSFKGMLYILGNNPFLDIYFANIFTWSVAYNLIFLTIKFVFNVFGIH